MHGEVLTKMADSHLVVRDSRIQGLFHGCDWSILTRPGLTGSTIIDLCTVIHAFLDISPHRSVL